MPSIKEVKNRIGSVKSTQQLTKAMKMVAAAKLKKAQDKVLQLRPYSKKLNEILSNLSGSVNNNLFVEKEVKNVLVVIISSDKGLCGSFNSNLIKQFSLFCDNVKTNNISVLPIGKKAHDLFKKSDYNLILDYWQSLNGFDYEKSSEICDYIVSSFLNSKYDKVSIIYNEFKNVAVQKSVVDNFLPVIPLEREISEVNNNYIFEPNKNKIVNNLIPQTLKTQFLKAVLESNASEQGSRMTAMSQATDNAGELLKELKLTYNRTRQAAITKEILEIVGGAEALNN
ncbi:MAG: ATP synthase F1 subunit gamma [Rhodothermaeota bacterium MED-G16]|nr:MAG: ATP synthase F1 subunit gamma [Rhodothermaeota bacterium MED-G16]|tara:strand:- start:150 stop:1001 length:852 start_codon:yes stop_codon:yes gene_type:complete